MIPKSGDVRSNFYAVSPLAVRPENPLRLTAPELRKQQFKQSLKGVIRVPLKIGRVIKPTPAIVTVALFAVVVAAKAFTGI